MALLAEQKRKARFGLDPRNTSWSNDTSKFGQRLMEKMGWEKGKGLGANENGITEHIRATYKSDSRGLGCTPQDADAWIAHQDDFNDLLKALNSQSEAGSQEEKVERTEHVDGRKRYHGRFARGQVQTLRSTDDLDCIFGKRKGKSQTAEPDDQPAPQPDCGDGQEEKSHGLTTVTSTSSVQEYFAKKMAEMKARKEANTREDDSGETPQGSKDGIKCEKKKKKQKSSMFGTVSFSYDEVREVSDSAGVDGAASKSCRGWYKEFLESGSGNAENIEVKDKSSKKKKQKKAKSDIDDNDVEEKVKMSDSKKQKKKDKMLDDSVAVINSHSVLESTELSSTVEVAENKQSKKKKKNKDSEAVPTASECDGASTANINEEQEDVKTRTDRRKTSKNDEGEDKKQSKKKKKDNEAVPAVSVCEGVENDNQKKQKKKRKASNKDEIVVSNLNKCALDANEVDLTETTIDASSLKHSSKGLVTHSNEIHDDDKQEKENSDCIEHKKKNKKRKQSKMIDEESKPVENKCANNDNVVAVESKKKKKRKHSEINYEESKPVESECGKNDDSAVEPKKKKKRSKGNDHDAQDTEGLAAAEQKGNMSSGNQNITSVSQSSEQKEKKKRKRKKKKTKRLQDQKVKSNAFFPGSNLAEIVGYGYKSAETKKCSKEDSKSSKQKT